MLDEELSNIVQRALHKANLFNKARKTRKGNFYKCNSTIFLLSFYTEHAGFPVILQQLLEFPFHIVCSRFINWAPVLFPLVPALDLYCDLQVDILD